MTRHVANESVQFSLKGLIIITAGVALAAALIAAPLRALPEAARWHVMMLAANSFVVVVATIFIGGLHWRRLQARAGERLIDIRSAAVRQQDEHAWRSGLFVALGGVVAVVCLLFKIVLDQERGLATPDWAFLHMHTTIWSSIVAAAWVAWRSRRQKATEIEFRENGVIKHGFSFHPWSSVYRYYLSTITANTLVVVVDGDTLTVEVDPARVEEIHAILRERGVGGGAQRRAINLPDVAEE